MSSSIGIEPRGLALLLQQSEVYNAVQQWLSVLKKIALSRLVADGTRRGVPESLKTALKNLKEISKTH